MRRSSGDVDEVTLEARSYPCSMCNCIRLGTWGDAG